jgi:DNA-binding beta-propeller fold protein YncE
MFKQIPGRNLVVRAVIALLCLNALPAPARDRSKQSPEPQIAAPLIDLPGGRKLLYERSFDSEREVKLKRGFWTKVLDLVAGPPEMHNLVRPYGVVADSRGRVIVTDPGIPAVHIFDFDRQKYKLIHRAGKQELRSPQCVAVDAQDNFYVTDSDAGMIFIFDNKGDYRRTIGALKGGEGMFKRPTGIAIDSGAQRIYVSDTWRQQIFVLDMDGSVLQKIGKGGAAPGEFNFPTELRLTDAELLVVDAMNFRVQVLQPSGQASILTGGLGDSSTDMFRPKGIGLDSEHNIYVVDGLKDLVQVFNHQGQLLYYFGGSGTGPEEFQLPAGLFVNHDDRIYIVDSYNRRVQVLRYIGSSQQAQGSSL